MDGVSISNIIMAILSVVFAGVGYYVRSLGQEIKMLRDDMAMDRVASATLTESVSNLKVDYEELDADLKSARDSLIRNDQRINENARRIHALEKMNG